MKPTEPTTSTGSPARYVFQPVSEDRLVELRDYPRLPLEQTFQWGRFQGLTPGRRHLGLFEIRQDDQPVGLVDLVEIVQRYYSYVWAKNGPYIYGSVDDFSEMITQLATLVKSLSPVSHFLRLHSEQRTDSAVPAFGFHITRTVIAVPQPTAEQFIATMPSKLGRNEARRSLKDPEFRVRQFSGDQFDKAQDAIDDFYRLWQQTAKGKGFGIHRRAYIDAMLKELGENCLLTGTYCGRQLLAGAITVFWGETATYYYAATGHAKTTTFAGMRCVLEALNEAYHRDCTRFDFLGIEDGNNGRLSGVTRFKKKFTENVETLPPVWDIPLKRTKYRLLRALYRIGR